jgi:thioredoxin-like negative regulator of GroEL
MKRITSEQFESYFQFENHFYAFFSSDTCRHCATITPILEKAFAGSNAPLYNINNEDPYLNEEMGVEYYPTVLEIKNGKVIKKYVGFSRLINEYESFI